ncbi:hypothetical protein GOFOIKOB_4523 [Methylobacterium tardum]|uniref:Uncharacterized protein n=1 Tax=Methylobacterium tardum TaxID=374432 RepID=A0AA37TML1_9HYPH|nr:hypothetical protein [Methylobacterium tardum]URD39452.1 hypothetical protein M6G65_14205 [Methylobacterium tardum]GJE51464.1 hypothetical protein GOFOIKOB_4523 [Methylobacterium tardum]GLS73639.1 hypothetical protein GCM10007890_56540 [Methylobacterium tardum]
MRTLALALAVLASLAAPAEAGSPPAGVYCSVSGELPPIVVGRAPGRIGIDLLDCRDAVIAGGRLRASRCHANGGAEVDYDTSFRVLADGVIVHEMELYRITPRVPCP